VLTLFLTVALSQPAPLAGAWVSTHLETSKGKLATDAFRMDLGRGW
jgi:hypothetical protein